MDPSARELTAFVEARGRRRILAGVAASAIALLGIAGLATWWPDSCDAFVDDVCSQQGDSDHCLALAAMREDLRPEQCTAALEAFETIEELSVEEVASMTGMHGSSSRQWAELRMVLKFRVTQLAMRGLWPRQALQDRAAFEAVLRTAEAR